jgi:hypothetical protein
MKAKKKHHYLQAAEIVTLLKSKKWNPRMFAAIYGPRKHSATMHLVFTGKLWTSEDLKAWNDALKKFERSQKKIEGDYVKDSAIVTVKKGSKKQRKYFGSKK